MASYRSCVSLLVWLAVPAAAQSPTPARDSDFVRWAKANSIPLESIDRPYADSSFAFLRPLVGSAHILSLGEVIHGGHEPLEFRNRAIKYAVTHLGFTGVALESGLTEADLIDEYIHDGTGNRDSVAWSGLTYGFGSLIEDRELVSWLREHNAHATRKVNFYGVDLTGGDDYNGAFPGAPKAVWTALDYLGEVAPMTSADLRSRLGPMMDRFIPPRYHEYAPAERTRLRVVLDSLYQTMVADSSRYIRASSPRRYAHALRNAWMAGRLNDFMAMIKDSTMLNGSMLALRDSTIAEDVRWALGQEGDGGRLVFFAHDGHVMNTVNDFRNSNIAAFRNLGEYQTAGHHLRQWFGQDMVVIASTASSTNVRRYWTNGASGNPSDPSSWDAALARVGRPEFVLDLRRADRVPNVASTLTTRWPFRVQTFFVPVVPREAFDAIVYFDRDAPAPDNLQNRKVDPQLMFFTDDRGGDLSTRHQTN